MSLPRNPKFLLQACKSQTIEIHFKKLFFKKTVTLLTKAIYLGSFSDTSRLKFVGIFKILLRTLCNGA